LDDTINSNPFQSSSTYPPSTYPSSTYSPFTYLPSTTYPPPTYPLSYNLDTSSYNPHIHFPSLNDSYTHSNTFSLNTRSPFLNNSYTHPHLNISPTYSPPLSNNDITYPSPYNVSSSTQSSSTFPSFSTPFQ